MTLTSPPRVVAPVVTDDVQRTARTAGALYLSFFVVGVVGTVWLRGRLLADDPVHTLANLRLHPGLAGLEVVLEMAVAAAQAGTALWLRRLFHAVDPIAAGSLVALAVINATAVLGSAALLATAVDVSDDTSLAAPGGAAATVQLLHVASGHLWSVAGVFFGLWLLPLGALALRSRWFPAALGWLLVAGGVGYVLSAVLTYLTPDATGTVQALTAPSLVAELWIAVQLLAVGVHDVGAPSEVGRAVRRTVR